jgi:hypothetical protein
MLVNGLAVTGGSACDDLACVFSRPVAIAAHAMERGRRVPARCRGYACCPYLHLSFAGT